MIQQSGLTLAYIGDVYYEFAIRKYLVSLGETQVNVLHKRAIRYTSGEQQSRIVKALLEESILSEEEVRVYKRGRNSGVTGRKNISAQAYQQATGFEALIGYLHLSNNDERADALIAFAIDYINQEGG